MYDNYFALYGILKHVIDFLDTQGEEIEHTLNKVLTMKYFLFSPSKFLNKRLTVSFYSLI